MKTLRKSLIAALGFAILVAALVPSLSDARDGFAFGFANRVAGSYLGQVEDGDGRFPPFPIHFNFHRDGTAIFSDFDGNTGVGLGPWKRTGDHQITGTFLQLQYLFPGGFLNTLFVSTYVATFTEDFKSFEVAHGNGRARIFQCSFDPTTGFQCPDPFDPNSMPIADFHFRVNAKRIPTVQND